MLDVGYRINFLTSFYNILNILCLLIFYQLDFVTPGNSALEAISLKQIRHKPKSRMKPWLRPHFQQRLIFLEENFGVLLALMINAFLAI